MRYAFSRANLEKKDFINFFQQNENSDFFSVENGQKILSQFFENHKMALNSRDSWLFFLDFDKTAEKKINVQQVSHIIFDETENQYFERQNKKMQHISSSVQKLVEPNVKYRSKIEKVPDIIAQLEGANFYQRKSFLNFFQTVDKDGDGRISHRDLFKFAKEQLFLSRNDPKMKEFIQYFDSEASGSISFKDFYSKIFYNVSNQHLEEKENQTNLLKLRQFNSQKYLSQYSEISKYVQSEKNKFIVHKPSENRFLKKFLHSQQI